MGDGQNCESLHCKDAKTENGWQVSGKIIGRIIKIAGANTVGVFAGVGCFCGCGSPAEVFSVIVMAFTLFRFWLAAA